MDSGKTNRTMDRRIFDLGLSVEATSLYLLCCSLVDQGSTLSARNLQSVWNSTPEAMDAAMLELSACNIVVRILSDGEGHDVFRVLEAREWSV